MLGETVVVDYEVTDPDGLQQARSSTLVLVSGPSGASVASGQGKQTTKSVILTVTEAMYLSGSIAPIRVAAVDQEGASSVETVETQVELTPIPSTVSPTHFPTDAPNDSPTNAPSSASTPSLSANPTLGLFITLLSMTLFF